MDEITFTSDSFYDDLAASEKKHVHLILIATKPDIIKQVPLYLELKKRDQLVVLGHTGQHYDENLSGGMLKEFGVEPDFNLNVRGSMHEIVSQIIGRLGHVIGELKERGKIVIPYVHGDTTTAMAASNAGYCHMFASVHVEAGIRTLTPKYKEWSVVSGQCGEQELFEKWRQFLMNRNNWDRGSQEPYPEQFNTRCSEAATGIHLAPVELDREFMLSEGFAEDRIFVVGNSVSDATKIASENAENALRRGSGQASIFERFPMLADGDFVRFCIHRRENCVSEKRFKAIYGAMKQLIEEGRKVLLINMIQTKKAFERFGLEEELHKLDQDHENFVLSDVWPQYTDVIAAMKRAAVCATDSGSMQEEMNILGVPCVTLRFGSDRSESIIAGANVLAPPIGVTAIVNVIKGAWNHQGMRDVANLYGENASTGLSTSVSAKCIDTVLKVLESGEVFRSDEARLGL